MTDWLADRFFAAIEAGDVDTLRRLYAPDAIIWHNDDGLEQSVDDNLRVLRWLSRTVMGLSYTDIRRITHDAGFVQQHVLRGEIDGVGPVEVPAALFVTVADDRIIRLDEYVDSAGTRPFHDAALRHRENRR
ncbi:nuclear transport factor 2 family protein [Gordonia sp. CPCC 205515]|uniref:nuclear transport factor 2 family protein n=1 Tax=Gordonia sp. CPCC 205515 TaxID=3140791 RepID=UPI003AF34DB7